MTCHNPQGRRPPPPLVQAQPPPTTRRALMGNNTTATPATITTPRTHRQQWQPPRRGSGIRPTGAGTPPERTDCTRRRTSPAMGAGPLHNNSAPPAVRERHPSTPGRAWETPPGASCKTSRSPANGPRVSGSHPGTTPPRHKTNGSHAGGNSAQRVQLHNGPPPQHNKEVTT